MFAAGSGKNRAWDRLVGTKRPARALSRKCFLVRHLTGLWQNIIHTGNYARWMRSEVNELSSPKQGRYVKISNQSGKLADKGS